MTPHRGPVFLDFPLDVFGPAEAELPDAGRPVAGRGARPRGRSWPSWPALIAGAERPAFIVGSDVYWGGAWDAAAAAASSTLRVPCCFNGLGRGCLPADHELAFLRHPRPAQDGGRPRRGDRHAARLPPRLRPLRHGRGRPRRRRRRASGPATSRSRPRPATWSPRPRRARRLHRRPRPTTSRGSPSCATPRQPRRAADARAARRPTPTRSSPTRVYGELTRRLERDAVVICDGGDFASLRRQATSRSTARLLARHRSVRLPGQRARLRHRGAGRPARRSQIVALLGDGAAGFSLMDADTLVRHDLPVVMIVGNNGIWGLEKHPMQAVYGWDVACDLQPGCRYDEVVRALGGAGETVTEPGGDRPGARPRLRRRRAVPRQRRSPTRPTSTRARPTSA